MQYKNPIIKGFNPDPSVCRVGDDYYLVTSTFEYFPGIPVYHSKDLINWEIIGSCINRKSQLDFEGVKASAGIWAPTIRYYNGKFYVTATFSEHSNFIVQSDNPACEWSDPIWVEMDGIDPSIFFEDGKMYYCANDFGSRSGNGEGISIAQIEPDTGKVIGDIKRIWTGTGGGFLEAPHIYHIGDWYYLLAAEGGSSLNHMEVAARSQNLFGEYESCPYNPILTNRHDTSKQVLCSGHADLVDDISGNWWLVHLGVRPAVRGKSTIGRETFLMPVQWVDGWPMIDDTRKSKLIVDAPISIEQKIKNKWSADFEKDNIEPEWLFLRNPNCENYQLKNGKLFLKLTPKKLTDEKYSPTFMAVRQPDVKFVIETEMEFEPNKIGEEAGLAAYVNPMHHYRICKCRKFDGDYIAVERIVDDFVQTAFIEKSQGGILRFLIRMEDDKYIFEYSENGGPINKACELSAKFLSCEIVGRCFTGGVIGIYAQSDKETDTCTVVHSFVSQI